MPFQRAPLTGQSTIDDWLGDPIGSTLMKQMLAAMKEGSPIPATDEVFKLAGDVPLSTFIAMGGGDPDDVIGPLERALADAADATSAQRPSGSPAS